MKNTQEIKYFRAKDRIKKIKHFRWFAITSFMASVYMIGFSVFLHYTKAEDSFVPITIFLGTTFCLWIILLLEYIKTFQSNIIFNKEWEEEQIRKHIKDLKQ